MSEESKQATSGGAGRRRRRKRGSGPRVAGTPAASSAIATAVVTGRREPSAGGRATAARAGTAATQPPLAHDQKQSAPLPALATQTPTAQTLTAQTFTTQTFTTQPRRGRQPAPKRAPKKPPAEPRIGVGCIVLRGDEILMVREKGRWSLPKGGLDAGELVQQGAIRETYEETGLNVELRELAFVVEFQAKTWGHHLQFFYLGREVGGTLGPRDPDREVQEAKFIPLRLLREYLRFRPRLVALETWLRERRPRHFVFDLDREPAMLRQRRRVGETESA
ncbi:NUDIX hydrolase [Deinococcus sp.]|uniref:NUDIX hydrolase n=1 Tax=Deinococcus sp. TaxID=47478 RepID=UPI003CC5FACF